MQSLIIIEKSEIPILHFETITQKKPLRFIRGVFGSISDWIFCEVRDLGERVLISSQSFFRLHF
jgi:hypothetical protein